MTRSLAPQGFPTAAATGPKPADAELERLWATLAELDGRAAYVAMWRLVESREIRR